MKRMIPLLMMLAGAGAQGMTLDEYMNQVQQRNKQLAAYTLAVEASNDTRVAGDLALSPLLTASHSYTSDKSLPSAVADKRDTTVSTLGLSKSFITGTTLGVSAETYRYDYTDPVVAGNSGYSRGGLGVSLEQSLWKDFFGVATRLRQDRLEATNRYETLSLELQRRLKLIEVESDFWDYLVAREDVKLKQANLDRTKKLESWTSRRVSNGISDRPELLQVQALRSSRELELANANEELIARSVKVRENLDYTPDQTLPEFQADMDVARPYVRQLQGQPNVVKIDSYLATLDADVAQKLAEETADSLRPDLSLIGRYNTSSYALDRSEMERNIAKTDRPVTFIGVTFSWFFGSEAVSAQSSAAKKQALAAKYRAEQAALSGENAWQEFLRKYELARQNVLTLEKIAQLQRDRSREEQVRFSTGRTITLNVVDAETESAEAEVTYLRARHDLRKLEAATQLYMSLPSAAE